MNTITQAQFWCHIPTKGGHIQTVRASDGYRLTLDRTSGILTVCRVGVSQVEEISPSAWISVTSEPPIISPSPSQPIEEPTKVWTKPKKK